MLRCTSRRRSPLILARASTMTIRRQRQPSFTAATCYLTSSITTVTVQQQQQRTSSVVLARPQQPQPQPQPQRVVLRLEQQQQQSMLFPSTPSFSSMMQHHQQQQQQQQQHHPHHRYPSNREAALTFAALLKTLRLPSQRLAVMSLSHPAISAPASMTLSVLEESMLENDDDDDDDYAWKEEEYSLQKQLLIEAPQPPAVSSSSLLKPLVLEEEEEEGENEQSFFMPTTMEQALSATTFAAQPHSAIFMDDSHTIGGGGAHEKSEQQQQQQQQQLGAILEAVESPSSSISSSSSSSSSRPVASSVANQSKQQPQQGNINNNNKKSSLREVQGRILHYVGKFNTARALQLFYDAAATVDHHQQQQQQQEQHHQQHEPTTTAAPPLEEEQEFLSLESVKQLFFLVSRKQLPFDSYRVLQYYQRAVQHTKQQQQQQEGLDSNDDSTTMEVPRKENVALYDVGMYERQCDVLRFLDPNVHSYNDIESLVRRVIADVLHKLDSGPTDSSTTTREKGSTSGQERCIPILVSALGQQRTVRLGRHFCPKLYQHMIDHKIDVSSGYLEHLLGLSKFHRQDDLPFPSILHKAVVEMNRLVEPVTVLNCVENLFPYTVMANVTLALESLIHLVKMENNSNNNVHADEKSTRYKVDISILEAMGAAAAAQGDTKVCLLIWDFVDLLNYYPYQQQPPSVMIYENTTIAFCQAGPAFYPNVFGILQEMQTRHGYTPCRALIRGLSTRFRYSHDNLDAALDAFLATTTTTTTTTAVKGTEEALPHHSVNAIAGFNAILAARAERGDLDHALELLDRIQTSRDNHSADDRDEGYAIAVVANADTYGFLFEALGKHLVIRRRQLRHRSTRQNHHHHHHHHQHHQENDNKEEEELLLQKCWQCADSFLTLMENQGIAPTTHILREYIELLCQMNDIATATAIVRETIQSNNNTDNTKSNAGNDGNDGNGQQQQQKPVIGNKTLYRVAVANANAQNFDVAREMAEMGSLYNHEPMPFLLQKINIMERADAAQDSDSQYKRDHGDRDDFDSSVYS